MSVGVRGLQRPAPYVQENLRHWDREGHKRESLRKERQMTKKAVEVLQSKPPGVPVETRWCSGDVHYIYLVLNYLITEVTLSCLQCSISFSPGATTPIGGCILQSSSGL